ncbi:hypothetical protein [Rhodobacter capsulatus]|jgi:hypothetical protein|uniref:SGNH/GDSL hydrolase family protein n=1 Tax=Rhodobacter capsulatus (strain ATCC BAA-309 / NBRC 16581 / SB1003) TaxID=272942 RepID=D5ATP3_RHOCB|nr:hypothetical protein [Rhodobacter capsulatus]ADE85332.1 conserved hypothetical protein [Rhodobacter capsulatus SB 1003]ETD01830.1 hypothetical protein U714_09165 [Rhodobacter capsulatus DE442]ETD77214.1 hypothetical protein U717_09330 [Rhodobacter capsulatus R121]ETE53913.1 hypothetical protein U715_09335 [Rhodobacter capsulatus Y262]MDS0927042.1 hypothetical protein [Rhodobacter capsulatus]
MTLRLCVIGNSHIAALKLGWDRLIADNVPGWEAVEPVFFGAPSDGMRHVALQGTALVPTRPKIASHFRQLSGGYDRIELSRFDAFVLVGLNVSSKRILRFYKSHAWVGLAGTAGKTLVHPAFAAAFLTERYGTTQLVEHARTIAEATDRPVLALAEPHWADWARQAPEGTSDYGWDAAITAGDGPALGQMFETAVGAALAPQAQFIAQPPQTVADGITTRGAYNKEASRLISGEGGGTDASHMNADFGLACWDALQPALAAAYCRKGVSA